MGTVEKLTLENMGIAFGILYLGGREPEIHLGVIYTPQYCNVRFKKYHCNTRVKGALRDAAATSVRRTLCQRL